MSFKADVYNVLIASPSDVNEQRDEIEQAIYEWNSLYAQHMNIVLLPRRWEKDVAPAYAYGNPQETINEEIVYNSDIVVGVFWHRMGAPTKSHPSGTLEELDHFINAGKDVLVYFVDPTKSPSNIDYAQAAKVEEYRKKYGQLGIYKPYIGIPNIKEHLYKTVTKIASTKTLQEIKDGSSHKISNPLKKEEVTSIEKGKKEADVLILQDDIYQNEKKIEIPKIDEAQITLNYSSNNGFDDLGSMFDYFKLRWSIRNSNSIYLYEEPELYDIGFNESHPYKFNGKLNYSEYDFKSQNIVLTRNQTALAKFHNGFYINIKLIDAKSKSHNDKIDSATLHYSIYYNI